jgi:hypothetical protein
MTYKSVKTLHTNVRFQVLAAESKYEDYSLLGNCAL